MRLATILAAQDAPGSGAEASWTLDHPAWLDGVAEHGPWMMLGLLAVLLARALFLARRFSAAGVLGAPEREAVRAAIAAAEARTSGEIVVVVVERSDRHPSANWLSALTTLVTGTVLLEGVLPRDAALLVLVQVLLGAAGFALAEALPAWKRMFVREKRAEEMAEEQARLELLAHGVQRTGRRTAVLVFVSLFEKRVVLLGDEGLVQKTGPQHWLDTDGAILGWIRRGSLKDGLLEGVRLLGESLAAHFPHVEGETNELADHLIVREQ